MSIENKALNRFISRFPTESRFEALAEACGLHITYVGDIEHRDQTLSLVNIVKLARGLKVKPGQLFEVGDE